LTTRPSARPDVRGEPLDSELVLYDPENGRAYVLNRTAALLWELCDGSLTATGLAEELRRLYGLDDHCNLTADVTTCLGQLERAGLLVA
jgi:PqqD family protein of HPr-rel-A system